MSATNKPRECQHEFPIGNRNLQMVTMIEKSYHEEYVANLKQELVRTWAQRDKACAELAELKMAIEKPDAKLTTEGVHRTLWNYPADHTDMAFCSNIFQLVRKELYDEQKAKNQELIEELASSRALANAVNDQSSRHYANLMEARKEVQRLKEFEWKYNDLCK
jgi:hypothetical protein